MVSHPCFTYGRIQKCFASIRNKNLVWSHNLFCVGSFTCHVVDNGIIWSVDAALFCWWCVQVTSICVLPMSSCIAARRMRFPETRYVDVPPVAKTTHIPLVLLFTDVICFLTSRRTWTRNCAIGLYGFTLYLYLYSFFLSFSLKLCEYHLCGCVWRLAMLFELLCACGLSTIPSQLQLY